MPDPTPVLALAAGLRAVAHRLGARTAQLYLADPSGALRLAGSEGDAAPDLSPLAETLPSAPATLDVSGTVEGVRHAVGQRAGRAALLAVGVDRPDASWDAAFADAVVLTAALAGALAGGTPAGPGEGPTDGHARLLHEVVTHPGSFGERLALALAGLAAALGLDAAAFARVEDGVWTPEAASDPLGLLPSGPVPLASVHCAQTALADGPVALESAGPGCGAYLGAPVFAGGRTVGTLAAVGRAARAAPFSADDRALTESLARWVGAAVGRQASAQRLADREAALAAFVDRSPVAMGLVVLDDAAGDVRFMSVNAAAARALGRAPEGLAGLLASEAGLDAAACGALAAGCRHALAGGDAAPPVVLDLDTPAGPRSLGVTLARLDVHDTAGVRVACVSFVAEDVTGRPRPPAGGARASLFERLHRDLRSPLTTILGYADLLGPAASADDVEAVREVVLRAGRQILAALDDAALVADASRVPVSLVPTDAAALVRAAVEASGDAAEAAGVAVAFEAAVGGAPLLLDSALVGRVAVGLLAAALAAPGARHVDARLADDGGWLVLDVGVRASPGNAGADGGPAALPLVEQIVERLGGQTDWHGDGAWRWTVRLPRRLAVVVDLPLDALPAEALVPEARVPGPAAVGEAAVWATAALVG